MDGLSVSERLAFAEDIAPFQRLIALDAIWSDLAESGHVAEGDRDDAIALLDELGTVLDVCTENARGLRGRLSEHPELLTSAVQRLLAEEAPAPGIVPLDDQARRYWDGTLRAWKGDVPRLIDAVLGRLADTMLPEERGTVSRRLESLRRGGGVEGDLHPCTTCGVLMATTVVFMLIGGWPIAFVLAVLTGYWCGTYQCLWNGAGPGL